ncbi:uncharacterized protein TNIN_236461 [Trichonephila inaurata madagascariensis]|uniref:SOCS box domain-containing protein n=1 Tax=Trichonephila inaurata madagascariensis TaxID=2747483 RepID=A0A8X7CNF8_9ARAC|nr:uncharacterized protein TNIN_236461 [Trichonephila inaurata madagascariensis]
MSSFIFSNLLRVLETFVARNVFHDGIGSTMGSLYSSPRKLETIQFFSDFCKIIKGNKGRAFLKKLNLEKKFPFATATMETLVHLWYMNCLSKTKWHSLVPQFRNRVMQDFIDTLYCTSNSFDEIFLLLFTTAKSRYFILGQSKQLGLSSKHLQSLAEDILKYASLTGLQYYHRKENERYLENLIDFPLKTFSLCPCTRRPLYVSMYLSRPDIVRLLLNCGARIPYEDICYCANDQRHPLKNVIDVMKAPMQFHVTPNSVKKFTVHAERCVMSLRILLVDLSYTNPLWKKVCETLGEITGQEILDNVPTLKHISRATIRSLMKNKRSFFDQCRIESLGLPNVLVDYLNIDEPVNSESEAPVWEN